MKPDVQAQIRNGQKAAKEFADWVRGELKRLETETTTNTLAIEELYDNQGSESRLRRAWLLVSRLFKNKR